MVERYCPDRRTVGGVCLELTMSIECGRFADSVCLIEAEKREKSKYLAESTKRRLDRARGLALKPETACVILGRESGRG